MLVSCVCLTIPARAAFLAQAISAFEAQDWPDKELVIVADECCEIPLERSDIAVVMCEAGTRIGTKRNLGSRLARGRFIVNWDDDDYSAPSRVRDQVERLMQHAAAVTSYRNLLFTDGSTVWLNRNWPGGYGTSLAFRRTWWERNPFPDIQAGEDWEFVSHAMRSGEYVAGDAKDLMLCRVHPGNTVPKQIGAGWRQINDGVYA